MPTLARIAGAAVVVALTLGCGPTEDRTYREGDSGRAAPAATPTQDARPDSTTGVARSSGQPGVAGDTIARSSKISAPKTP
jgi:hypothetical protein